MSTDLKSPYLRLGGNVLPHLQMAMATITASVCLAAFAIVQSSALKAADEPNRLAYLDECNPWYPHKDFPKLITPQWVGEEGVEAVIVLAIDDMRDPAKYEQYLRPILNRLKQIDGRAPVSIMTCDVKPEDAQLQSWLGEGLSIECHTIDHPCPILQGGDGLKKVPGTVEASPDPKERETPESSRHLFEPAFAKAKSTYDRCIDLMGQIPGNKPVAFRTPCCDSLNTVSPRFFSEIFSSTTENGNSLQIDSSVFTFFTSEDESLPKELVLDANGKERFWKYLPKNNKYGGNTHDNFVNYIRNYPYPYVINNSCWEIPCIAPSDWSAQHLHGINNPVTVEDWKAAIDLTVHKQGCFSLVFHPHGWIKPEQVVEMIDHAVMKHGNKVKFMNFKEVADRLAKAKNGKLKSEWAGIARKEATATNGNAGPASALMESNPELTKWWTGALLEPPYGLKPIRREDGTHNGFFIHDRHFCWINEDTARLPDLMYRVSFDEVLKASGVASAPRDQSPQSDDEIALGGLTPNRSPEYPPVPIGAAVVDITPDYPVRLTGYGNRMKESEGVAAKIHARAIVFGADQNSTVLITVDNCGVPLEMTEAVYERIAAKHTIPRERLALSSTHSHSAPWLRGFAPNIFAEVPADHAAHLAQYEKDLTDKLVDVVEKAIASQRPGHLSYGYGEAGFAMNRRALTNGKWSGFGEVPDGPTDKRVPVLAAHDVDGKLIAVLANYACHCTTETGEFNQISGDWAGFAADMLEADHPGAVALIAIGCGADANPSPRGTHEQAKMHGRTMADEVTRVLASGLLAAEQQQKIAPGFSPGNASPESPEAPEGRQNESAAKESVALSGLNNSLLPATPGSRPGLPSAVPSALKRINPAILCNMSRIDLPLAPLPSRDEWERQAKEAGVTGSRARYFLKMLDEGNEIPTTVPDYPVQTWCFGEDLAMVFLGGEVVVDYSIRMNEMFDSDRLWINAYSNDVPCYIASSRLLREGGYECDSSMLYYRRPTRLAPETEDLICDTVQKLLPHDFYSEALQQDFPAPKSPEDSLKCMTTKPDLRVVLAASEPLIRDPVAFDWDEQGRLWVVEMGDYPGVKNPASGGLQPTGTNERVSDSPQRSNADETSRLTPAARQSASGRVRLLEDTDKNGVYDKATTFLDNLAFPSGIHCWRGGVIVTMAPEIFYAEDTDGDGKADIRETLFRGFAEGNQQHRVNGLRWGLDGWLYLANGDSGGEIEATGHVPGVSASGAASAPQGTSSESREPKAESSESSDALGRLTPAARLAISLRGRDLRIHPDTNELDAISGQSQFGRERDDFGNWFGNNNSNPIWQYVLEDRYVRRNPFAKISQVTAQVAATPGAAPVYPTSRTLARFNDFAYANRFTSACGTMIYRDRHFGDQYYGNAFTSEPVHNLVSRLVLTRDGYGFKGERATDEQQSEFLASSDNWFRPTMIRTGPDGALWIADMYRAVIEHPQWIPPEYQRKMNLYAGSDKGRIYRIVPASECCGAGSSAAEQRQTVAPGVSPGNKSAHTVLAPEGRQNLEVASSEKSQQAAKSSPAGWTYFDMRWNKIPTEALVKRLESSNGWWRDAAQRILQHRIDELTKDSVQLDRVRQIALTSKNPAVRVQAMYLLRQGMREDADPLPLLKVVKSASSATEPQVRRVAIEVAEAMLVRNMEVSDKPLEALEPLATDSDAGVRLQLALSLGATKSNRGSMLLGQIVRKDADDAMLRNAALTSLTSDSVGLVLREVLDSSAATLNEALIGSLLAQAAAMRQTEQLGEPMTHLVQSISAESSASRLEFLSGLLSEVLSGDAASFLKQNEAFHSAGANAYEVVASIARNAEIDADRRAAAVRFAGVTQQFGTGTSLNPAELLTPQTPVLVQLAAVRVISQQATPDSLQLLMNQWNSFAPNVRAEVLTILMQRESSASFLLDALSSGKLTTADFDALRRDALINHRNRAIAARARELFDVTGASPREAIVQEFKSQISHLESASSNDERIASGRLVFEKRCAACHRLQDVGKEIGADLAALKDRSTDSLLTAILDPNRAVESKFLVYTVATTDGLQHSGMLKGETGGSLTLIGSDGKEITVTRGDIEEFVGSNRSLMPEGLEKDLSVRDLADVIAFVQSTGTPWKRFDGNAPQTVKPSDDGSITLPAKAAEIYGPSLVFEPKYSNLGFWTSADDYAKWTFEVPRSGFWTVELDFACDDSTAGGVIRFNTGNRMLSARVPGSGTWDHYQTWQAGTIDLHRGRGQLILTAIETPPYALLDLRAVRLIPPKD